MADLGSIGFFTGFNTLNVVTPIVFFKTSFYGDVLNISNPLTNLFYFPKMTVIGEKIESATKAIKGITKKDGVPSSKLVRLYDRLTGYLISDIVSNLDGSFEFNGLSIENEFYVVVLDNDIGSIYNAEISDHLFPLVD